MYFTQPLPPLTGCDSKSIFNQITVGLNSEFTFETNGLNKAKEPSLPHYLPLRRKQILSRALTQSEI